MEDIFGSYGFYFWWIVAGLLLIGELIQPGFFMIWFAAAAGVTGLIHFYYPQGWVAEVAIFAVLAAVAVAVSWRFVTASWAVTSDRPHLNQRNAGLVGKSYPLLTAIENGRGKLEAEGTVWDVEGADLPRGSLVKITGTDGLRLKVKAD